MQIGVSTHRAENYWYYEGGRFFETDVRDDANRGLYGPAAVGPEDIGHDLVDPRPSDAFLAEWLARTCELVDKYQPAIVWFDWWIQNLAFKPYLQKFAAYYYNRAAEWQREVAINYKYDAFEPGTAVFDVERGQVGNIRDDFWQTDTSVSLNSWCYIRDHQYRTAQSLIATLVDVVSKNGALLLNIGPKPDGTIPEEEQRLLREIGGWLAVNGDAIYHTHPWSVFGEGPVVFEEGAFAEKNQKDFTNRDIRYTARDKAIYGIVLARPEGSVLFTAINKVRIANVRLLGSDTPLVWEMTPAGLHVTLPADIPGQHAWAFEISTAS
jgi:alpha-L-fucosidase